MVKSSLSVNNKYTKTYTENRESKMGKPVDSVVIACFKKDMRLVRACVASVKYWHPDANIFLLKDYVHGDFDTTEIEKYYGAKVFETEMKHFGWPWSKLAILLKKESGRYLFLDSDTVFLGKVLDKLSSYSADIIVTGIEEPNKNAHNVNAHYIQMDELAKIDKDYEYPGFCFNGGHIVMTSGILKKDDFKPAISFEPQIMNNYPQIFKHGDQGALNYTFAKLHQNGKIKLQYADFWIWPGLEQVNEIDLNSIKQKQGLPYIMHWAGIKPVDIRRYKRYDIFSFYEEEYYKKIPLALLKKVTRSTIQMCITQAKIFSYKLRGIKYAR